MPSLISLDNLSRPFSGSIAARRGFQPRRHRQGDAARQGGRESRASGPFSGARPGAAHLPGMDKTKGPARTFDLLFEVG